MSEQHPAANGPHKLVAGDDHGARAATLSNREALELAFRWIARQLEGRKASEATCAYVPSEIYEQIKQVVEGGSSSPLTPGAGDATQGAKDAEPGTVSDSPPPPLNYRKPRLLEYADLEAADEAWRLREALTYYAEGRIWDNGEIAREALRDADA